MGQSSSLEKLLVDQAWASLVADAHVGPRPEPVEVVGTAGHLTSLFAVEAVAVAVVSAALSAAAALHRQRDSSPCRPSLDRGHVAAAMRSERYFAHRGRESGFAFAPLSRFWPTADGWIRTHANYPWHRAALLAALGTCDDVDAVAAALAERRGEDVEDAVFAAGGVAAAVRSAEVWHAHRQGRAVAAEPLIGHRRAGDAAPRARSTGNLPATGLRVLDLTRVIAGPVCTRYLGALGAEVLRLDPPHHLDLGVGDVADTLLGKRSAFLDLSSPGGTAALQPLLDRTDVIVCGYRPGTLERYGLGEDALADRHPGVVVVYIDAWGHSGPWAVRRGFDSIVQASTGIAVGESSPGGEPGALPCQLLDHATGYLAAAAALDGLVRQGAHGGTHIRRLSLARTASWLMSSPPTSTSSDSAPKIHSTQPWLVEPGVLTTSSGVCLD